MNRLIKIAEEARIHHDKIFNQMAEDYINKFAVLLEIFLKDPSNAEQIVKNSIQVIRILKNKKMMIILI